MASRSMPMPRPPAGGMPYSKRAQEVLVESHGFFVAGGLVAGLLLEAAALVHGVVQLGEGVADLLAHDDGLEALDDERVVRAALGQRAQLERVVDREGRLDETRPHGVLESLVHQRGEGVAVLHVDLAGAQHLLRRLRIGAHPGKRQAQVFLQQRIDGAPRPRGLQLDGVLAHGDLRSSR